MDALFRFLDGDDPGSRRPKLLAFERIFLLVVVSEGWGRLLAEWMQPTAVDWTLAGATTVLAAVALLSGWRRPALALLTLMQVASLWQSFPWAGNHRYLETVICGVLASIDLDRKDDRVVGLRCLRWAVFLVFFYAGLQKLAHGYYFKAQFLAYSMWREHFQVALGPLLSAHEVARLAGYDRQVGAGPYLVDSPLLVLLSNSIWILELGLALLLAVPRTRRFAVGALIAFMVGTQVVAREFFFGVLYVNAILLFARGDVNRRLMPLWVAFLAYLLMVRLGWLPGGHFT